MADLLEPRELRNRKQSVGTVELQGPGGQIRTVNLEEMTERARVAAESARTAADPLRFWEHPRWGF